MEKSRRKFIKNTAAASSATFLAPSIVSASVFGANDRINAAVLGVNGRGKSHISGLMKQKNVQVTTLCDPDMNIMQQRQADFKNKYDKNISLEQDLRRVMDDKDIDVVSIASPNHWHALSVIGLAKLVRMYMLKNQVPIIFLKGEKWLRQRKNMAELFSTEYS